MNLEFSPQSIIRSLLYEVFPKLFGEESGEGEHAQASTFAHTHTHTHHTHTCTHIQRILVGLDYTHYESFSLEPRAFGCLGLSDGEHTGAFPREQFNLLAVHYESFSREGRDSGENDS